MYYRYMNFEELYSIIANGKIRFKKPYNWDDKYESILEKIYTNPDIYSKSCSYLLKNYSKSDVARILNKLYYLYKTQYVCCFTSEDNANNEAMWKAFSYGKEIVCTAFDLGDEGVFHGTTFVNNDTYFLLKGINYSNIDDLYEYLKLINIEENEPFGRMLLYKRNYFEHENEIRLIMCRKYNLQEQSIIKKNDFYAELNQLDEAFSESTFLKEEYIDVDIECDLIKSVMINPKAQAGFEWCVKQLCEQNKVKFLDKSKIYDFPSS